MSDMETDEDYERVYTYAEKKSIGKSNESLLIQIADESEVNIVIEILLILWWLIFKYLVRGG